MRFSDRLELLLQLFLGDTNRAISSTPMNLASSRSHCIFTLHIESRKVSLLSFGPQSVVSKLVAVSISAISPPCFLALHVLAKTQDKQ